MDRESSFRSNVRIVRAGDWVWARPEGRLDRAAAERLLGQVASLAAGVPDARIMLDTRKADASIPTAGIWELAQIYADLPQMRTRRTALIGPAEEAKDMNFFATAAKNRGAHLEAFVEFEAAVEWITRGGPMDSSSLAD